MLRLTRKQGEGFAIDEQTFVWIVRTKSGRCELAIDAPQEIRIRRCELEMLPPQDEHDVTVHGAAREPGPGGPQPLTDRSDNLSDEMVMPDYSGFAHPAHQPIRPS